MAVIRHLVLTLVFLPVAASALAQPMTEVVQFDGVDVLVAGDFNSDSRLDLLTLEPDGIILRFGLRDAPTGVRWGRTPPTIDATDVWSMLEIVDLDADGRYELLFHDIQSGAVRSIEIPGLPSVPPVPDAVSLAPQWSFAYPSGGPPFEPFQPIFASFDGIQLQLVHRDNGFGAGSVGYRLRDNTGALLQSIDDEVPPSRADVYDVENDGRMELAILPASTIGSSEPKRVRIYKWTAPIATVPDVTQGAPSLHLISANPAWGMAAFRFSVPSTSDVELVVHDVQGRAVRTLVRGRVDAGTHEATWAGEGADGGSVPSGAYFVQYSVGGTKLGRKMVWLR